MAEEMNHMGMTPYEILKSSKLTSRPNGTGMPTLQQMQRCVTWQMLVLATFR